nr:MAG: hypothetical protein [Enquatrovirus sp.]
MKLKELFQNLALGELSGSPFVELNGYELDSTKLPRVIHAINQALTYIHTTFHIKQNQVVIQLKDAQANYYLDSDYAVTNHNSPYPKYILDTETNKYQDDLLAVLGVFGIDGTSFPLNDPYAIGSVFTPEFNCIQVPEDVKAAGYRQIIVVYKANHKKIDLKEPLSSSEVINLPSSYDSLLQAYVAYLLYMNMSGEGQMNKAGQFFAKVTTLTEQLKQQGIGVISQTGTNIKPQLGGWV